jgi:hypothetical protein
MVRLDSLKAYKPGDDPRPLFNDERAVFYPVTAAAGDVRSGVVVREVNGEWKAGEFGRANLAKAAHEGRGRVSSARGVASSAVELVTIPALSTRMLKHEERGVPMLTALLHVHGTDIRAGETHPAADVFAKLQPVAAQTGELTPN